jgi:hypothetical protein
MGSSPLLLFELPLFSVLLFFFEIPLFFRTLQHPKIYVPLPSFEILARGKHRKERVYRADHIIAIFAHLFHCPSPLPFSWLPPLSVTFSFL